MNSEVELKLAVAPGKLARLRRHPLLKTIKSERRKLHAIYFDTPKFDLLRKHGAFRLRREGYRWIQTLKLEGNRIAGLSERPEWEVQVTGNQPDFEVLPEPARERLDVKIRTRLRPLFTTEFQRTTWLVERPQGRVEIALDTGRIRAGKDESPISELELELKSGDAGLLFELAGELLDAVPMLPEARSKALRGYRLVGAWRQAPCKAVSVDLTDRPSASEAWRRGLESGLIQLDGNLAGFLEEDDPEYLHQMRVAVRRMRTLLGLGRKIGLVRDHWADELGWFMGELSPARDWDVMVTQTLADAAAGLAQPERLDGLVAAASARRKVANERARAAVAETRFARLLLDMSQGLMDEMPGGPALADWAGAALDRRRRRMLKLAEQFERLDASDRHRLRIAAKHLRYAGEAFAPSYGERAERYLAPLARLQDALGAANDAAVAHRLLAELPVGDVQLAQAVGLAEGFVVGASIERERRTARLVKEVATAAPFWRRRKKAG